MTPAPGTVRLNFTSNAAGVDSLGNSALPSQTLQVNGTGYNLTSWSTIGTVNFGGGSNADTLDFGTVTQGSTLTGSLFAGNLAAGPADLLAGLFRTLSGGGFDTSGLTSFSGR